MAKEKSPEQRAEVVVTAKPSAYETGRSHARSGRNVNELPFDPNGPDVADFRRGYDDELASRQIEAGKQEGAKAAENE